MTLRSITFATTVGLALTSAAVLVDARPVGAGQTALPAGNLVQNPGGDAGPGGEATTKNVVPARWRTEPSAPGSGRISPVQIVRYIPTEGASYQSQKTSAAINGGANFFAGASSGYGPDIAESFQVIDVAGAAPEIDAGGVKACLSGWFGGFGDRDTVAWLRVEFQDEAGATLGQTRIGGVQKSQRGNGTALLRRAGQAAVPASTRQLRVVLTMEQKAPGGKGHIEAGHADNISVGLTGGACDATLAVRCQAGALVATVTPTTAARAQRVRYQVRGATGSKVATASRAPFSARIPMTGLTGALRVTATVTQQAGSGNVVLQARSRRC